MVEMSPVLVVVVACGGCAARVRQVPHEETELADFSLLAPNLSPGTVLLLEDEGWRLPAAGPALCVLCRTLPNAADIAGTGWWVPIPSWTPLCDACGCHGFLLGEDYDPIQFILRTPDATRDDLKPLVADGWTNTGRLLCPACAGVEATRLFETLTADAEYSGMEPLFTLEVPRG